MPVAVEVADPETMLSVLQKASAAAVRAQRQVEEEVALIARSEVVLGTTTSLITWWNLVQGWESPMLRMNYELSGPLIDPEFLYLRSVRIEVNGRPREVTAHRVRLSKVSAFSVIGRHGAMSYSA